MKWYEQRYVSHRDWILDNLDLLGLQPKETVIVLLIDFMNEKGLTVSIPSLASKSGMSEDEINRISSVLVSKKYLDIIANKGELQWRLNGLFEADVTHSTALKDRSLIDTFEQEFGRPLNPDEMDKISTWNRTYDKKLILYALREASAYRKLSCSYVDRILQEWSRRGVTVESIEKELSRE